MEAVKIQTYRPGKFVETSDPVPHTAPLMGRQHDVMTVRPKVWHVIEPDLAQLEWLMPRLAEGHPGLNEPGIWSWLRAAITDRRSLLIRSEKIVGLFETERSPLSPDRPGVVERFVRSREPSNDEAALLYIFARDWAHTIGAAQFGLNRDSDCAMSHVYPALSDVKKDFTVKKSSIYTVFLTGL